MIWSALSNTGLLRLKKKTTLDYQQFIRGLTEVTYCSKCSAEQGYRLFVERERIEGFIKK